MANIEVGLGERFALKPLRRLQIILASAIPVAAILVVGAVGTQHIDPTQVITFTIIFLLCAVLSFIGERAVITLLQRAMERQYTDMLTVCQDFMAGNKEQRILIHTESEQAKLAGLINTLLDQHNYLTRKVATPPQPILAPAQLPPTPPAPVSMSVARPTSQPSPDTQEAAKLNAQLELLLNELSPIVNGDLSVRATIPEGYIGVIADTCNSLIEELGQFTKWTRYASQQVASSSHSILDRSIDMAKTTETQMMRLSQSTESVEKLVAFIQRMSSSLQLSVDVSREIHKHIQLGRRQLAQNAPESENLLKRLAGETQRQTKVLEEVLASTETTASIAESLIGDLYTIAQHIHQSSTGVLKTAEKISELEALAERWGSAASAFTLDEDETEEQSQPGWLL